MDQDATRFLGERINEAVVRSLRTGKAAGMTLPDASDPSLETFQVVRAT
jgi:hypothetical protein